MTKRLDASEWRFEPSSVVDPVGRVIHHDGRILRAICPEYVPEVRAILQAAEANRWFDYGLVPTWETEYAIDGHPLVLEHQRIPFVTLRAEWPAEAIRQAALRYLSLAAALARSGYCLKDAHTLNVLFDATNPVVTDFGSIRPLGELDWSHWLSEFHKFFLVPLILFAEGQAVLARALTRELAAGVGQYLIDRDRLGCDIALTRFVKTPYEAPRTFEELSAALAALSFPLTGGEWTSYPQPAFVEDTSASPRPKEAAFAHALGLVEFSSVVDLGCNRGLHALMCESRGASVVACDIDEICLNELYGSVRARQARVLPLYLDLLWPLGSEGVCSTIPSASERLRADLVLALAIVHHLALRRRFHLDVLADGIAAFSRHAAVVEFVPIEDWHVVQWRLPLVPNYSKDVLVTAMLRHFEKVTVLPSDPAPRELLVFERRRTR